MIDIKLKYLSGKISRPEYQTRGSAGMDLAAAVNTPLTIRAGESDLVPTGIAMKIPMGYAGFIFSRTGLASKKGIALSNGVGVIDNDYTAEIKVALINNSNKDYTINPGDRIAQFVILPIEIANFVVVDELPQTQRGVKGFGSTGK